jgi:hypothetical protein
VIVSRPDDSAAGEEAPHETGDATVPLALPPRTEAMGRYAEDKLGGAMHRLRRLMPKGARVDNRRAGVVAVAAGVLAVLACYLTWIQVEVAGRSGPGSTATGLDGRDGITVLVAGILAAAAGIALLLRRGDGWLKVGLFAAGGVITVIGIVDIVDVRSKAEALEDRYGIPEAAVTATVGVGLWLVLAAGVALLVAAVLARRAAAPAVEPDRSVPPDHLAHQREHAVTELLGEGDLGGRPHDPV